MRLDDVILALYMTSDSFKAFYDMVAHEITWLDDNALAPEEYNETAERLDTHDFKRLPDKHDINEYDMMESSLEACDFHPAQQRIPWAERLCTLQVIHPTARSETGVVQVQKC